MIHWLGENINLGPSFSLNILNTITYTVSKSQRFSVSMILSLNAFYHSMKRTVRFMSLGLLTWSDTNMAVQPQNMVTDLKLWIYGSRIIVKCSEKEGADQLHSNHTADLHLYFAYAKTGFLMT